MWWHKGLLLLHSVGAVVLLGGVTHSGWLAFRALVRGKPPPAKLEVIYAHVIAWAYGVTAGLGLLIYPRFRVHVRADDIDSSAPWAVALFEVKEHWVAVGAVALVGWVQGVIRARRGGQGGVEQGARWRYAVALLLMAVVWLGSVVGWLLVMLRSV